MQYRIETRPGGVHVRVDTRWTFQSHMAARQMMQEVAALPGADVTVDVAGLDFIDSAGVGMLLIADEEWAKVGKSLEVVGAQGSVARVFRAIDLATVLRTTAAQRAAASTA